jgi:hypothetical protein
LGDKTLEVRQYVGFTFGDYGEFAFVADEYSSGKGKSEDRNELRMITFNKDFRSILKSKSIPCPPQNYGAKGLSVSYC